MVISHCKHFVNEDFKKIFFKYDKKVWKRVEIYDIIFGVNQVFYRRKVLL